MLLLIGIERVESRGQRGWNIARYLEENRDDDGNDAAVEDDNIEEGNDDAEAAQGNGNQAYQSYGDDDDYYGGGQQQNNGQSNNSNQNNPNYPSEGLLDTPPRDWTFLDWTLVVSVFLVWGCTAAFLCRLYHEVQESLSDFPGIDYFDSFEQKRRRRRKRSQSSTLVASDEYE